MPGPSFCRGHKRPRLWLRLAGEVALMYHRRRAGADFKGLDTYREGITHALCPDYHGKIKCKGRAAYALVFRLANTYD
jgi:hypothetical protein